jgi:anion-transporting  ArsA/GET3 family ATPase
VKIAESRLVLVMGKGGVGRSTVAAALGLAAGHEGRRTCVVEMHGASSIAAMMELDGRSYWARSIGPGTSTASLSPRDCMAEYGRLKLKVGALARLVFGNRVVGSFVDAVPGMHDLLQLGKVEHLLVDPQEGGPPYDLIVLDVPATGHGLTFLASARAMMEMTRVGPFHDLAESIDALLSDPGRPSILVVALPEELPVSETLEFLEALGPQRDQVRALAVNQVRPPCLPEVPGWEALRAALESGSDPDLAELVRLGDLMQARLDLQERAVTRLAEGGRSILGRNVPLARLPRLETPPGPAGVAELARALGSGLGGAP